MKVKTTTSFFDRDVKVKVIDRSSQRNKSRPKIRRKVVVLAQVDSDIKQEYRENFHGTIGFYTQFTMYKSIDKYYLQIAGVSTESNVFPRRNKLVEFEEPYELFDIICDDENKLLWWSPLTEKLIDGIVESEYLTEFEIKRWYDAMIDEDE